jgi:endonuclease YncB( thermonuclease family)
MIVVDFAPSYKYAAVWLVRVIDGDTIKVTVDLPFDTGYRPTLRLIGYDAGEMDAPNPDTRSRAFAARDYLVQLVTGVPLYIETYKERRSFVRYTAKVWIHPAAGDSSLVSVSDLMLASGLVVPWP